MKKQKRFNIVSLTDWHVPFESSLALNTAFAFCGHIQPDIIIIHECHDFYSLSNFDKDPERENKLQEELDQVDKYFWALRKVCPKSRIILLKSNHLDRLRRYLWRQAKALNSLRDLKIEHLLKLKDHNIEYFNTFTFRGVLFKHGNIVRKHSGATARAEFEKEGTAGNSGHSHRLGVYYVTKRGGSYAWGETGCLCGLNPEYIDGTADWQSGVFLTSFKGETDHYTMLPFPIIDGEILYGNVTITI